jgi:parallel beta-helix repeat protein
LIDRTKEAFRSNKHPPRDARLRVTVLLIAMLVILVSSVSIVEINHVGDTIWMSNLTPRSPITINGDSDFSTQATSEGWSGNGTAGNPFIIENCEIDAMSYSYAIHISNTIASFSIRNCSLFGASQASIGLLNVVNGTIENNTCFNNVQYGIYFVNSARSSILECNCSDNGAAGVFLQSSTDCRIENNTCDRDFRGIYLQSSSDDNWLANNSCSDQEYGILLYSSVNCTLRDNSLNSDGIVVWGNQVDFWNRHDIDTSNEVNSKPVYYYKDEAMMTVPSGAGQVILANCENMVVQNQNFSDSTYGIEVGYSRNSTIANNSCRGNEYYGIVLVSSDNNTVRNNTCENNKNIGIYLSSSNLNDLSDNSCRNNLYYAIYVLTSASNLVLNNSCSGETVGIYIDSSTGMTLRDNQLDHEGVFIYGLSLNEWITHSIDTSNEVNGRPVYYYALQSGITVPSNAGQVILASCSLMIINGQNLSNASAGIELAFSDRNVVSNSTCGYDSEYGILLYSSNRNVITLNDCSNSSNHGIFLYSSSDNTVNENRFADNLLYGVCLFTNSNRNLIWNNTFLRNNGATAIFSPARIQGYDSGVGNRWNTSGLAVDFGNYWGDWTAPDLASPIGRVDFPYPLHGSALNSDMFPLTAMVPIPEPPILLLVSLMLVIFVMIRGRRFDANNGG